MATKEDFINTLIQLSDTELNDYIKKHGKPPKKVRLYHLIDKDKYPTYEEAQVIHIKM